MITEGWMNHKGGRFTADISEIEMHTKSTNKDVHCPGCKAKLKLTDFKVRRDDDNDISTWTLKHECGADMTIFNESTAKPSFSEFIMLTEIFGNKYLPLLTSAEAAKELITKVQKQVETGKIGAVERKAAMGHILAYLEKEAAKKKAVKEAKSTHTDGGTVKPHDYSVKMLSIGKTGKWPALKGEIYEKLDGVNVLIGTFSRGATRDGYVPPIESKFRTDRAKMRFQDFADSLSVEETIEALLPKEAFR